MAMTITHQILHNIIVENSYPIKSISLGDTIFHIRFSPENFNALTVSTIEFLSENVTAIGIDGTKYSGSMFIRELPIPIGHALISECIQFQNELGSSLFTSLKKWSLTFESRNLWTIFKETSISSVLTLPKNNKPSVFQRTWIIYNSIEDEVDRNKLIEDVIKTLHPWLNTELWVKMEERDETQRENWQFDDADIDRKLQEKADRIAKERQLKNSESTDPDVIEIEEI